jgi:peptidyl-prolyl cis-trans isomerase C
VTVRIVPVLLAALCLSGCDDQKTAAAPGDYNPTGEVIAEINGQPLHQDLIDVLLKRIPESQRIAMEQAGQMGQIKEQVFLTEVLYQEAMKQGLESDPAVQTSIAFAARSALADALVGKVVDERMTDERIQQWYNDHLVQYAKPQVKLSHIILNEEGKAEELMTQLQGGADFAALATANTIDPNTKENGGAMDEWVTTNQIQGEVGAALGTAKNGDVIGPFSMGPGVFALLKIDDRREQTPIADVTEEIRAELDKELTGEYIDELRTAAEINDKSAPAVPTLSLPPAVGQDPQ